MLKAASWYARKGYYVLPLHWIKASGACSCGNAECSSVGKHPLPAHGLIEATVNVAAIEAWWTQWSAANIGIATGPSGLVVVDIDPKNGGTESFAALCERVGRDQFATVTTLTGGGGEHYWFRAGDKKFRNSSGLLGAGIDVRADGGYVVAPPSQHVSGNQYRFEEGYHVAHCEIAALPLALADVLAEKRTNQASAFADTPGIIPAGQRDNTLASLAGSLRRRGLDSEEIYAALLSVNERRCQPPLPKNDVRRISTSIARYEAVESVGAVVTAGESATLAAVALNPEQAGFAVLRSWTVEPELRKYATGFPDLDGVLKGGLRPGELTVLGAWTGIGKSGFAEQVALEISKESSVLFLPLELGVERTERRLLAKITRTSEDHVQMLERSTVPAYRRTVYEAVETLQSRHLSMFAPGLDETFRWQHVEQLIVEQKPDVVVIDHLQHLDDWATAGIGRSDIGPGNIIKRMRKVISSHKVHIICVQQLKAEKIMKSQRPQLYDFADTSAFSRLADTILMLHRPFRGTQRDTVMEILVLKNRRGPEPWVHVYFMADYIGMLPMTTDVARNAECCKQRQAASSQ